MLLSKQKTMIFHTAITRFTFRTIIPKTKEEILRTHSHFFYRIINYFKGDETYTVRATRKESTAQNIENTMVNSDGYR